MIQVQAPAKLNLSLRILGKRDDGFHEIDTTMFRVDGLHDELEFSESEQFSLTCDQADLPLDEGNLVTKAVRAFEQALGESCRFSIHLVKRIPDGAGLGGGSSDAAATLRTLNEQSPSPVSPDRLMEIAGELGSDVPFFLGPSCCRCTGRGEVVEPFVLPPVPLQVLLLKPGFAVHTPDAYGRWKDAGDLVGVPSGVQELEGLILVNDLERPVFAKHRFLAELKVWLLQREEVVAAQLSGSGSTVFALLHVGENGDDLAAAARLELDPTLWHWCGGIASGPASGLGVETASQPT